MTATLHITAEPEPRAYHGLASPAVAFGISLALEHYGTEGDAMGYIERNFEKLKGASLHLYKVKFVSAAYTSSYVQEIKPDKQHFGEGEPGSARFLKWIGAKYKALTAIKANPHPFHSPQETPDNEAKDGAAMSVGQILRASQMLDAPVPQRLGLARIALLEQSFEREADTWHVLLIWARDDEIPPPAPKVEPVNDQDGELVRFKITYEPFAKDELVEAQTSFLTDAPTGNLGLVDAASGFLNAANDADVHRALRQFEETAATRLWTLPHLLEAVEAVEPAHHADMVWLKWLATVGTGAALDPIFLTLAPDIGATAIKITTEGPILAEIVWRAFDNWLEQREKLKLADLPNLTEMLIGARLHARTLEMAGKDVGLSALLAALVDRETPDALDALVQAIDGTESDLTQARVTQALGALSSRLQDEAGAEAAIIYLLDPIFNGPDKLANEVATMVDANDTQKQAIAEGFAQAWADARSVIAGEFNGAEAVRHTASAAWLDALVADVKPDITLAGCQRALKHGKINNGPKPPFFALRLGLIANTGRTEKSNITKLAMRFWAPSSNYNENIVKTLCTGPSGLNAAQNRLADAFFSNKAPADNELRLMVPDNVPSPLPLQISSDINGAALADFQKYFDGFGLMVKRTIDNEESADNKESAWSHANLVQLQYFHDNDNGRPTYSNIGEPAFALRPVNPMPVDGRTSLFIEYQGLPLSGAAFDHEQLNEPDRSNDLKLAYAPFTAVDDVDNGYLPPLAYGANFQAAAFGVTKAGTLPISMQDGKPWRPKAPKTEPPVIATVVEYKRRTAIGRVALDILDARDVSNALVTTATIREALHDVHALSGDYPRVALASTDGASGRLDIYRNTDGRGALVNANGANPSARQLTLTDLRAWGGAARLTVQVFRLQWELGVVSEAQVGGDLAVNIAAGIDPIDAIFEIQAGGELRLTLGKQIAEATAKPDELKSQLWLRLTLTAEDSAENAALSLADPAHDGGLASEGRDSVDVAFHGRPDTVATDLLAPSDEAAWQPGVPQSYTRKFSFPRVTFADFDRWVANPKLRKSLWGRDDADVDLTGDLLRAYVYRHLPPVVTKDVVPPIADIIDRLPDPAVAALVIDLVPLDRLSGEAFPPKREIMLVGSAFKFDAKKIESGDAKYLESYQTQLKAIDTAFSGKLTVSAMADEFELKPDGKNIEVTLPPGLSARLTIRPAVLEHHFDSVIHQGLRGHARDTVKIGGREHLVFGGAEAVFEVILDDLGKEANQAILRNIAPKVITCRAGAQERSYALDVTEPEDLGHRDIWRRLSRVDILTQRWRFSGRPIYTWPAPARLGTAKPGNPVVGIDLESMVDEGAKDYLRFEDEAFFDRPDSDADRVTIRLDPIALTGAPKPGQVLQRIDWSPPTATYFRHRFELVSRYAGALRKAVAQRVRSWTDVSSDVEKSVETLVEDWTLRVAMLADHGRIELNRPQVRALLPMTQAPEDPRPAGRTPPLLVVLDERPFAQGGLADRILGEIRTGANFGFQPGSEPVEPIDMRKEFGPDPRLELLPTPDKTAQRLHLEQEGPIGLTFDSRNIAAPAFANSQHLFRPTLSPGDATLEADYWQEHALGVSLRRILDPGWTVANAGSGAMLLDVNSSWLIKFCITKNVCSISAFDVEILKISGDRDKRVVSANNTAIYPTKQQERFLPLCVCPPGAVSVLHQALGDGRYQCSVLVWPKPIDIDKRLELGTDTGPRLMASFDWTVPDGEKVDATKRKLTIKGNAEVRPAAASLPTETEWITLARDSAAVFKADENGLPEADPIPIERLTAFKDNESIHFTDLGNPLGERKPIWLLPRLGETRIPKTIHRHLAVLGTSLSTGLGRQYEVFEGATIAATRDIPLANLSQKNTPTVVRLIEFETPALAVCINSNNTIDQRYRGAYFDLLATGGEQLKRNSEGELVPRTFRLWIRPVGDDWQNAATLNLAFLTAPDDVSEQTHNIELHLKSEKTNTNVTNKLVFIELRLATDAEGMASVKACGIDAKGIRKELDVKITGVAVEVIAPEINQGLRIKNFTTTGYDSPLWADISLLHIPGTMWNNRFDFDWIFGATGNIEGHALGTLPDTLIGLREAQARIVSVSPAISIS